MKKKLSVLLLASNLFLVPISSAFAADSGETVTPKEFSFRIPNNTYCTPSNPVDFSFEITNAAKEAANFTLQLFKKDGTEFTGAGSAYDGIESSVTPGASVTLQGNGTGTYHILFGTTQPCTDRVYSGKIVANSGTASLLAGGWVDSKHGTERITVNNNSVISLKADGGTVSDTIPPAQVTNLAAGSPTKSSISLNWTAPGDDGNVGTATYYDIRYSTTPITDANWSTATQATNVPIPQVAGTSQSMVISGLNATTTYYFALKSKDKASNISPLSNVASATTTQVTLSDSIIPHMTSNTSPSGVAFASSENSLTYYQAWNAFDGANNSKTTYTDSWAAKYPTIPTPANPAWIGYDFQTPTKVNNYALSAYSYASEINRNPSSWQFQGYNETTSTWDILDTQTNQINWKQDEIRAFSFTSSIQYSKYRLLITGVSGGTSIYVGELLMY